MSSYDELLNKAKIASLFTEDFTKFLRSFEELICFYVSTLFRRKRCSRAEKIQIHLLHTWTDQWSLKSSANELSEDQNKQPTSNDSTLNKQWTEILIDDKFEDSISEET